MPKPMVSFTHSPEMYRCKFEQINAFLDGCRGELADDATYYKILKEREEFVNWLKQKDFLCLFENPIEQKTRVHWDNYLTVLHLFIRFDLTLAQCPCNTFSIDEKLYFKEQEFTSLMTARYEKN